MKFSLLLTGTLLGSWLPIGCHAEIEDVDDPEIAKACRERTVPDQPLRRLSSRQWTNVMRDLFGELAASLLDDSKFPVTEITGGFTNDAAINTVNSTQSNLIEDEALRIGSAIAVEPAPYLAKLMPCGTTIAISGACIDSFIQDFGRRAYRRPVTAAEAAKVRALFDSVQSTQSPSAAWAAVVQFFVQSPSLLYRIERGTDIAGPGPNLVELDSFEMASRLSFLFTDSGPDDDLYAAAERGELATAAQIEAQARRLLGHPRFAKVVEDFHHDWLRMYEANPKDPVAFPLYTDAVQASLAQEVGELTRFILAGNGTISDVLGTTKLPVDATSAGYYGVTAPASGFAFAEIPNRRGILTLASVQAALSGTDQTRLFHRASFIYHDVLCENPLGEPDKPEEVAAALADTSGAPTARERNAPTGTNGACSGCHQKLNPIAFAFENFDPAGAFRTTENGAPIDATGTYNFGTLDAPELFEIADAAGLVGAIADHPRAQRCYTLQWFRASTGRPDVAADRCSTTQLQKLVRTHGGDLRELMVALTQIDAFRYRTTKD